MVYGQGIDAFRQSVDDEAYADDDQWRGGCCHGLHQGEDAREQQEDGQHPVASRQGSVAASIDEGVHLVEGTEDDHDGEHVHQ